MILSRRNVIKSGATLVGAGMVGAPLTAQPAKLDSNGRIISTEFDIQDAAIKEIAQAGVDSAISHGASYSDARITFTKHIYTGGSNPNLLESMEIGIRSLVDGYWGFASSPIWHLDEAARLGVSATDQAKANVVDGPREMSLSKTTGDKNGHWIMPVKDDPFKTHYDEIKDLMGGLIEFCHNLKYFSNSFNGVTFEKQYRVFVSSEGHYQTQIFNRTQAVLHLGFMHSNQIDGGRFKVDQYTSSPGGIEVIRDKPMRKYIQEEYDILIESWKLPLKPIDVGRYNTIIDQHGMAKIASPTIGFATEIDRAMGFEANASGTSYVTDPVSMLGTLKIGAPNINIYADRSYEYGMATVGWDDEGVKPISTHLIKNGILNDMQTTREGADWIKDYYNTAGKPIESKGYALSQTAMSAPMSHTPNLFIEPNPDGAKNMDELRKKLDKGIEMKQPEVSLDFQQSTGFARGQAFEIKDGKRVARLSNAGVIFRGSEIWGNINEFGGKEMELQVDCNQSKGEPKQDSFHTVRAVPAVVRDVTFVDITRKA